MKTDSNQVESGDAGPRPSSASVIAAFAAIYLIWGSTYLAIRFGVESLPPFLLASTRFLFAGALLYAFARWRGAAKPDALQWRDATIAGGLMLMIGNGGVTWAEQVIPSSIAALLVALVPLWMVLLDWMRPTGRRPGWLVASGLTVGFIGVAILVRGNGHGSGTAYTWGVVALIVSSICWAAGSLFSRHARKPESPLLNIGLQMIAGGTLLLLVSIFQGEPDRFSWDAVTWRSANAWIYLTVVGSLIGFPAYVWLLRVSTPARVSTYAYVNPLVAVLLGCTLGNERLTHEVFVAGGLIILAVALIVGAGSWQSFGFVRKLRALLSPTVRQP